MLQPSSPTAYFTWLYNILLYVEKLIHRQRDPDQKVRMEVVTAICDAASENISKISQQVYISVSSDRLSRALGYFLEICLLF